MYWDGNRAMRRYGALALLKGQMCGWISTEKCLNFRRRRLFERFFLIKESKS